MKKTIYILEMQKDKAGNPHYTVTVDEDGNILKADMYLEKTMSLMDFTEHLKANYSYFKDEIEDELNHQKAMDFLADSKRDMFDED